jgi:hypothetical protein
MNFRSRLRRLVRSESGAELIEFSLTLPLLLLIVLGIIEFGFLFREYEVVTNAAREGARIAILSGYEEDDVIARVEDYLETAGLDLDNLRDMEPVVAASKEVGAQCISMVPVKVEYDHAVPFISGVMSYFGSSFGTITLSATASMRTEVAAGPCP